MSNDRQSPEDDARVIEGVVGNNEPRCTRHAPITHHGFNPHPFGLPAHTWDVGPLPNYTPPGCRRCSQQFQVGDRYLCDEGGIVHVACPASSIPPASTPEATR